ncbi:MAG: biotin--[acetyl-CoA-carboxylase] ligase, partial [Succinivibrio sp.]
MGSDLGLAGAVALLRLLSQAPGMSMGRQEACDALSVSEDALGSAVSDINSIDPIVTERGGTLMLSRDPDLLDAQEIFRGVHGRGRVEVLDVAGSTNTIMLSNAANAVSGDVLMAEIQTAGRGRRGNRWSSGIGRGLALSLAWRFEDADGISPLAVAAGAAVSEALDAERPGIMVKWPNDLVTGGGKLAGILIETEQCGAQAVAVIGIGVNVYSAPGQGAGIADAPSRGLRSRISCIVIDALRKCC